VSIKQPKTTLGTKKFKDRVPGDRFTWRKSEEGRERILVVQADRSITFDDDIMSLAKVPELDPEYVMNLVGPDR
jgi:hypothetical protein